MKLKNIKIKKHQTGPATLGWKRGPFSLGTYCASNPELGQIRAYYLFSDPPRPKTANVRSYTSEV